MKKNILVLVLLAAVFSGCEKTIELDLKQSEPKIVIEGLLTDHTTHNYVKITRTTGFYSSGKSPRVTDATVMVEDDAGNSFTYLHNPNNHADSAGFYVPEVRFKGVAGRTYKLTVVSGGQTYEASDKISRIPPIDRLAYRINEDEQADPEEEGKFYEVLMWVKEPQETRDYYLFRSFSNGEPAFFNETDIYYADDELIGENIDGISIPAFFKSGDKARIEVFSLSRSAFIFYRDLQKLLTNDGGMFGAPPANPRTNLSNGALGFFQASALEAGEILVGE